MRRNMRCATFAAHVHGYIVTKKGRTEPRKARTCGKPRPSRSAERREHQGGVGRGGGVPKSQRLGSLILAPHSPPPPPPHLLTLARQREREWEAGGCGGGAGTCGRKARFSGPLMHAPLALPTCASSPVLHMCVCVCIGHVCVCIGHVARVCVCIGHVSVYRSRDRL